VPPSLPVSVIVTGSSGATTVRSTVITGGGPIVKVISDEVPPPGGDVVTRTCAVPSAVKSLDGIAARSVPLSMSVVGRGLPFHSTTERTVKPPPSTVRLSVPARTNVRGGESDEIVGTGLSVGMRTSSAFIRRTRGMVEPGPK